MIGLAYIAAFVVYLIIFIAVVWLAARAARKRNIKRWKWGVPAALFMYLVVFWDHIPSLLLHDYYCESEAGFWIYTSPEQWVQKNPGVAETLVETEDVQSENGAYILNQRFRWSVKKTGPHPVALFRHEQTVFDVVTGEVMARYVDFSRGYGNPFTYNPYGWSGLKFWLGKNHCKGGRKNQGKMGNLILTYKQI